MSERLDDHAVRGLLPGVAPWKKTGEALRLECRLRGFPEAMALVNRVAGIAEDANHHPDITIRWNRVILDLSTHSAGGLTKKDFDLATKILEAVRECGAEFVTA